LAGRNAGDGELWFTDSGGNRIGRISTQGAVSELLVPTPSSNPVGIAATPSGSVFFTEQAGNKIGRVN
jgi:virginiamycin B lyase